MKLRDLFEFWLPTLDWIGFDSPDGFFFVSLNDILLYSFILV